MVDEFLITTGKNTSQAVGTDTRQAFPPARQCDECDERLSHSTLLISPIVLLDNLGRLKYIPAYFQSAVSCKTLPSLYLSALFGVFKYFQPSDVWQEAHSKSATVCIPVLPSATPRHDSRQVTLFSQTQVGVYCSVHQTYISTRKYTQP